MILLIQIVTSLICACLFSWGGYNNHNMRRFVLPLVLVAAFLLLTQWDWKILPSLSVIGIFCLGYGEKSPLRHVFGNGWGRSVWGLLSGLAISLPLFLSGHIPWYVFLPYLGLSFILENALKDIPQVLGDLIIGAGFASIVFFVH